MTLDAMLLVLSERTGLSLVLDQNGSCSIEYGTAFEMSITAVDRGAGVLLHEPILVIEENNLPRLRQCMVLNLYGTETMAGTLAFDPQAGCIILWRRIPLDALDVDRLETAITTFMSAAREIRLKLGAAADTPASHAPIEPSQLDLTLIKI